MGIADTESLLYGIGRSLIKGLGYEYVDFRDYMWGDDIRHIDWRLSARLLTSTGDRRLVVREYMSEKLVEVLLAIDLSKYMFYWDKLWTVLYTSALVLRTAHVLGDKTYVTIIRGDNIEYVPFTKPLEILDYLVHVVCREKTSYPGKVLARLIEVIPRFRSVRAVVVITGYNNEPEYYLKLGYSVKALEAGLGLYIVTSKYELNPSNVKAVLAMVSPSGRVFINDLGKIYEEITNHVMRCKAYMALATYNVLEILGSSWARENKHRIIQLYVKTRHPKL